MKISDYSIQLEDIYFFNENIEKYKKRWATVS